MEKKGLLYTTLYWNKDFPHISEATHEIASETATKYKEAPITHKQISILPLEGQGLNYEEINEKEFWTTDPYPSLESQLLQYVQNKSFGGKATFFGGEAKIWSHILGTVSDIKTTDGIELDVYHLTPTDAVFLIKEIIRRKISYDDLLAGNITEEKIANSEITTARPDILQDYQSDKVSYDKNATKYVSEVDTKTVDQMLDHGYLICRHISALSSIIYEILRKKQNSVLMNGSYLVYHDESMGDQAEKASVGEHAFNILYVTNPKDTETTIKVSVVDNTGVVNEDQFLSYPDSTVGRISQCCSSLYEIGHLFDVSKDDIVSLADKASQKLKKHLISQSPIFSTEENLPTKAELLSDFLSLLYQGTTGKSLSCLDQLHEIYLHNGKTRVDMIEDVLLIPPATFIADVGFKCIQPNWIPEIVKHLKQIDFSQKSPVHTSVTMLIEHIVNNLSSKEVIFDKTGYYMDLLTEYHRMITQ